MLKKWVVLALSAVLVLTACHSQVYNQTEGNVADVKLKIQSARKKSDNSINPPPPLLVKKGPYVDTTPINLDREPSWLSNHIVIRGDQLPFSYYSRTIGGGAGTQVLTNYQTALDPTVNVSINYTGTIKGALDLLAAKTGYAYKVRCKNIYWEAFITRTFDIAFMPGEIDYLMGKASGSTAGAGSTSTQNNMQVSNYVSSDSSDSEFSSLKGTLSIWKDLEATIKQMLSPDGKVIVSQATTSVTVRDRPSNVDLVGQYIKNLNVSLAKQVLVKVQVLEVDLENDFTFGINWQIIANAFNKSPFVLNANYGTPVSITTFTPQSGSVPGVTVLPTFGTQGEPGAVPSYTILFNALNQQGKTAIVSEPRVVCLNNQVCEIRIISQQGYLASVQNTTLTGASTGSSNIGTVTSQMTPGTVITGLTLYILPKILKENVFLQVNADLSSSGGFTTVSSTGSTTNSNSTVIQVPNIGAKHFNQRSVIKSGDTLILSGFRQLRNIANANQFINSQALGGKGSSATNAETIVLITPIILDGSA